MTLLVQRGLRHFPCKDSVSEAVCYTLLEAANLLMKSKYKEILIFLRNPLAEDDQDKEISIQAVIYNYTNSISLWSP